MLLTGREEVTTAEREMRRALANMILAVLIGGICLIPTVAKYWDNNAVLTDVLSTGLWLCVLGSWFTAGWCDYWSAKRETKENESGA